MYFQLNEEHRMYQQAVQDFAQKEVEPLVKHAEETESFPEELFTKLSIAKALSSGRLDGKGGLSARSVLYHHRILSETLRHALKMGIIARNVSEFVDPPRPTRKQMNILSTEEIGRFLDTARETDYYVFFSTLLCTGLRRGELLALRWRNLDLNEAILYVTETAFKLANGDYVIKEPKTPHSRRAVSLPPSLSNTSKRISLRSGTIKDSTGLNHARRRLRINSTRWKPNKSECHHTGLPKDNDKS